jgi:molybdate transport system ATP-binding protein
MLYVTHSPAEALALGTRLLRWEGGQVVEEGAPLDLLSKRIPGERFENVWQARILHVSSEEMEIRLEHGPNLIVVPRALPVGSLLTVRLRADEIVLARGEITGLSVRNIVEGEVREVWSHDREAQVVVRAGGVDFVAGLTRRAVESLALSKGVGVSLVIKAKSIQVSENSC